MLYWVSLIPAPEEWSSLSVTYSRLEVFSRLLLRSDEVCQWPTAGWRFSPDYSWGVIKFVSDLQQVGGFLQITPEEWSSLSVTYSRLEVFYRLLLRSDQVCQWPTAGWRFSPDYSWGVIKFVSDLQQVGGFLQITPEEWSSLSVTYSRLEVFSRLLLRSDQVCQWPTAGWRFSTDYSWGVIKFVSDLQQVGGFLQITPEEWSSLSVTYSRLEVFYRLLLRSDQVCQWPTAGWRFSTDYSWGVIKFVSDLQQVGGFLAGWRFSTDYSWGVIKFVSDLQQVGGFLQITPEEWSSLSVTYSRLEVFSRLLLRSDQVCQWPTAGWRFSPDYSWGVIKFVSDLQQVGGFLQITPEEWSSLSVTYSRFSTDYSWGVIKFVSDLQQVGGFLQITPEEWSSLSVTYSRLEVFYRLLLRSDQVCQWPTAGWRFSPDYSWGVIKFVSDLQQVGGFLQITPEEWSSLSVTYSRLEVFSRLLLRSDQVCQWPTAGWRFSPDYASILHQ